MKDDEKRWALVVLAGAAMIGMANGKALSDEGASSLGARAAIAARVALERIELAVVAEQKR